MEWRGPCRYGHDMLRARPQSATLIGQARGRDREIRCQAVCRNARRLSQKHPVAGRAEETADVAKNDLWRGRGLGHGFDCASSVAASIRVHHLVPHHIHVHDRLAAWLTYLRLCSCDGPSGVPGGVRILAENLRGRVWTRSGVGGRDGVPVRHELGRPGADGGTHSRGAAFLRNLHSLFSRGQFFWNSCLRTPSRSTVVLPVLDGDGGAWHHAFGVLDPGQQQLDAGRPSAM